MDDLVQREGILYQKFSDVPFNGKLIGGIQGSIENGKREGAWVWYHSNGQVMSKLFLKNGLAQGTGVRYYSNGQLHNKVNYKDDKEEGAWVSYWDNGQLASKGNWNKGKKEGAWITYKYNGTVHKEFTGTFKDGKKISD